MRTNADVEHFNAGHRAAEDKKANSVRPAAQDGIKQVMARGFHKPEMSKIDWGIIWTKSRARPALEASPACQDTEGKLEIKKRPAQPIGNRCCNSWRRSIFYEWE